jgi:hypothetical protein
MNRAEGLFRSLEKLADILRFRHIARYRDGRPSRLVDLTDCFFRLLGIPDVVHNNGETIPPQPLRDAAADPA